jgi:hypothetical protein
MFQTGIIGVIYFEVLAGDANLVALLHRTDTYALPSEPQRHVKRSLHLVRCLNV